MLRWLAAALAIVAFAVTVAVTARWGDAPVNRMTGADARQSTTTWPRLNSAVTFFLAELRQKTHGDWNAAWRTLYPLHQAVASELAFVTCERALPFPAALKELHVVAVRKSLVRVPGLTRLVPGVAVDVHVELNWYGPRDPIVFKHTFHLIPVHGRWTWLLSPSRYKLYRRRACLTALAV